MKQIHYLSLLFCSLLSYLVSLAKHFVTLNLVKLTNKECDDAHYDMYLHENDAIVVMELLGLDTKHMCSGALKGAYALLQEKESSLDELKQAFAVFDTNGDGFISAVELMSVMSKLRLEGKEIEDCERMIRAYDKNCDGNIDFEDFRHLMENAA